MEVIFHDPNLSALQFKIEFKFSILLKWLPSDNFRRKSIDTFAMLVSDD